MYDTDVIMCCKIFFLICVKFTLKNLRETDRIKRHNSKLEYNIKMDHKSQNKRKVMSKAPNLTLSLALAEYNTQENI